KSANAGASWSAVLSGTVDGRLIQEVTDVAVDPQTPSTVYAAWRYTNFNPAFGGLFKSTNGGSSWTYVSVNNKAVDEVIVDPSAPSILYAETFTDGVYRSSDGGGTWGFVSSGLMNYDVIALRVDPGTHTTLYAATSAEGGGLFKTVNSGTSWSTINARLPGSLVNAVGVDPQTPATLYAATSGDGVQKSTDRGASWASRNAGLPSNSSINALVVDPQTPTTVY